MSLRTFAVCLTAMLAALVGAQAIPGSMLKRVYFAAERAGVFDDPTQPRGFPIPPERDARLPAPLQSQSNELIVHRAEKLDRSGDFVVLEGGVVASYQGYDIYGDRIEGDLSTQVFRLIGKAQFLGQESIVAADWIEIRFKDKTYSLRHGTSELRPSFVQGRIRSDLYLSAKQSSGYEQKLIGDFCTLTTCSAKEPHFHLVSRSVTLIPGKRITLRSSTLMILNHKIITIPYISMKLDEKAPRYVPEVGQNQDEGYFVKSRWGIPVKGDTGLDALLDYMTKKGPGLGSEYFYRNARMDGNFKFYTLTQGQKSVRLSNLHRMQLGPGVFQINSTLQQNNYLSSPGVTQSNIRSDYTLKGSRSNSTLGYTRSASSSTGFSYTQQALSLLDTRQYNDKLRSSFEANYSTSKNAFSGGSSSERKQVDLKFRASNELKLATAEVEYLRTIPVGQNVNFFSTGDKTPVFSLKSDGRRLLGNDLGDKWPFQTEISIGELQDPIRKAPITRTNFEVNMAKSDRADKRLSFGYNSRFRQAMYSDDTAQYIVGLGGNARYNFSPNTSWNIRYSYLRPYGFTPLSFDQTGRTNLVSSDITVQPHHTLQLAAQTGYDITQLQNGQSAYRASPWQTLTARMAWQPESYFLYRMDATYDTTQRLWNNVRFEMSWSAGATLIAAAARYDASRSVWGSFNLFVNGLKYKRVKASVLLAYNGYTQSVDSLQYSLTYDLHCAEAILSVIDNRVGFRPGRQIALFVRLKALPFDAPFGVGTSGQPIGLGTGSGF